jgi:hypothetical protein
VAGAGVLLFQTKTGREIRGKVVSTDGTAKTITLKQEATEGSSEEERTLAVDEKGSRASRTSK